MLANSSNSPKKVAPTTQPMVKRPQWLWIFILPVWVFTGFLLAQFILALIFMGVRQVGVSIDTINEASLNAVFAASAYVLSLIIVIGLPWILYKRRTTMQQLGLERLPRWSDLGLAPVAFVVYIIASGLLVYLATQLLPEFDPAENQDVGFNNLSQQFELLLAFATLVIIAPIAEEVLFRGYLYGKLRKSTKLWIAVLITSILFAALHTQYDGGVLVGLNVAIDVFMLSVVMCLLREFTGSIWAGILLHMTKNGLAFYLLFINPTLLTTMGML